MLPLIRIALRNVVRNRRRSLITLSAVFLALGVMTSIRGFLNGLQGTLREGVIFGQTGAVQVHKKGFLKSITASPLDLDIPADAAFLGRIAKVPGVKAVTARIPFGGMVNANDITAFGMLFAIDPVNEIKVCPRFAESLTDGKPLAAAGPTGVLLSPELSTKIGVKLGQRVTLLTGDRDGVLNAVDVSYAGTWGQAGIPLPDKKRAYVPLALAQNLLRMPGRATEIAIAVDNLDEIDAVKARVQAVVGPDYEVSTWHEVASFVDGIIAGQNFVLNLIAGIFLLVALIGVANTMLMSVLERTREIGTMMSVGVRRRQILGLFLLEAALLGFAGGALGAGAGMGFILTYARRGIEFKPPGSMLPIHVYPSVGPGYVLFIFALAAAGAALAALLPSLRASRLRPVEALTSV